MLNILKRTALGTVLAAAISAAGALGSAKAADLDAMYMNHNWTGLYVGGTIGFGTGHDWFARQGGVQSGDLDPNGIIGGATLGWNFQADQLVFGIEADISDAAINDTTQAACAAPGCRVEVDWLSTVRGRVGYSIDKFLVFGTGGLAIGGIDMNVAAGGDRDTELGFTLGGGLEYALTDHVSLKAEYLYVNLSDSDIGLAAPVHYHNNDLHIFRVGANVNLSKWLGLGRW